MERRPLRQIAFARTVERSSWSWRGPAPDQPPGEGRLPGGAGRRGQAAGGPRRRDGISLGAGGPGTATIGGADL